MILRNIDFPPVLGASGVQGFFGNKKHTEYKHSKIIRIVFGDIFRGMGFVAKTATLLPRKGNVDLDKNGFSFKKFLPNAIYPMPFKGAALNAVGLSNPGFEFLLRTGLWQKIPNPFMLSYMPMSDTPLGRVEETEEVAALIKNYMRGSTSKFGIQLNISCPNTGKEAQQSLVKETFVFFDILGELGIPIIPKINALLDPETAFTLLNHKECDALCVSNTIPFGQSKDIEWEKYSMKDGKSPLQKYGYQAGGLSGSPIFPIVVDWLERFHKINGRTKPIIAGGGVMSERDVEILSEFYNVEAISIGSVGFLKPWRVQRIIKKCYEKISC